MEAPCKDPHRPFDERSMTISGGCLYEEEIPGWKTMLVALFARTRQPARAVIVPRFALPLLCLLKPLDTGQRRTLRFSA